MKQTVNCNKHLEVNDDLCAAFRKRVGQPKRIMRLKEEERTRRDSDSMNLLNSSWSVPNTVVLAAVSADSNSTKFLAFMRLRIFFRNDGSKKERQPHDNEDTHRCHVIIIDT